MSGYAQDELSVALSYALLSAPSSGTSKAAAAAAGNNNKKENKKEAPKKAEKANDDFDNMFGDDDAPAPAPAAKKADDFDNMFGDDDDGETEEEKAANKARQERMALARKLKEEKDAKEGKVKKDKPKEAEKSLVVLEVKPWEADTDLEAVWKLIIAYEQEGLSWGQTFKLEPVAFGIKKLVLTCTIVDALVLLDDITEKIESLEDHVQSVEIASMNKI